eukprot:TRINITY_DN7236_c0_g1_i1.p1 TRINITY_DN7236_c0_g1~~TRINITY_DN7236_c0_g1_i1.p1  ORF type:complete len:540 (-),score=177.18 TRINITY_DN7236_c0_g1_i1:46-1665(-)
MGRRHEHDSLHELAKTALREAQEALHQAKREVERAEAEAREAKRDAERAYKKATAEAKKSNQWLHEEARRMEEEARRKHEEASSVVRRAKEEARRAQEEARRAQEDARRAHEEARVVRQATQMASQASPAPVVTNLTNVSVFCTTNTNTTSTTNATTSSTPLSPTPVIQPIRPTTELPSMLKQLGKAAKLHNVDFLGLQGFELNLKSKPQGEAKKLKAFMKANSSEQKVSGLFDVSQRISSNHFAGLRVNGDGNVSLSLRRSISQKHGGTGMGYFFNFFPTGNSPTTTPISSPSPSTSTYGVHFLSNFLSFGLQKRKLKVPGKEQPPKCESDYLKEALKKSSPDTFFNYWATLKTNSAVLGVKLKSEKNSVWPPSFSFLHPTFYVSLFPTMFNKVPYEVGLKWNKEKISASFFETLEFMPRSFSGKSTHSHFVTLSSRVKVDRATKATKFAAAASWERQQDQVLKFGINSNWVSFGIVNKSWEWMGGALMAINFSWDVNKLGRQWAPKLGLTLELNSDRKVPSYINSLASSGTKTQLKL